MLFSGDTTYTAGELLFETGRGYAGKVHDDFLGVLRLASSTLSAVGPVTSHWTSDVILDQSRPHKEAVRVRVAGGPNHMTAFLTEGILEVEC